MSTHGIDRPALFNTIWWILLFIGAITILECGLFTDTEKTVKTKKEEKVMAVKPIKEVLKEHTQELMSIQGVVGIGEGIHNENPCIKVFVIKNTPEVKIKIPGMLGGYPVIIVESGQFKTF